ncbi:SRPBCC domain-containing protein [soil metagenome]
MENKKQINLTRIFDAPRELVWKMWTTPEHFIQWYGVPPVTVPATEIVMDVRAGGRWHANMVMPDGKKLPFHGLYKEVLEPEKLVFVFENPADPSDSNTELVTVTFAEKDGKTEMVFNQTGHLPDDAYEVGLKEGWTAFFDRLKDHITNV